MTTSHQIDGITVNTATEKMGGGIHRVTCWIGQERFRGEYLTIKDGANGWIDKNDKSIGRTKADAAAHFAAEYASTVARFNA